MWIGFPEHWRAESVGIELEYSRSGRDGWLNKTDKSIDTKLWPRRRKTAGTSLTDDNLVGETGMIGIVWSVDRNSDKYRSFATISRRFRSSIKSGHWWETTSHITAAHYLFKLKTFLSVSNCYNPAMLIVANISTASDTAAIRYRYYSDWNMK